MLATDRQTDRQTSSAVKDLFPLCGRDLTSKMANFSVVVWY